MSRQQINPLKVFASYCSIKKCWCIQNGHICNKDFDQYDLEVHFTTCHILGKLEAEYKCQICDKVYVLVKRKTQDKTIHVGQNKNHKCDICDKAFSQQNY